MSVKKILIVDDDPHIRSIIAQMVKRSGHSCQTAADGVEALSLIQKHTFDIIISDISMPRMSGLELMRQTRERFTETAFIIITGYSEEYKYDQVIGAGANEFIMKPFTTKELETKLDRIFHERLLQEENRRLQKNQENLNAKLSKLLAVASDLSSELDFDRLFPLIIRKVTEAMNAERTSLYIIDWKNHEIWTKVAEQVAAIRLPLGQGISGRVAETGQTINIADAWELPYFNREFDLKHNFRTRSVLCIPISDRSGERIAVLQVINREGGGRFTENDATFLKGLAGHVSIALENSFLIEELSVSFESSIRTLSATVDAKHPLTAGHSQRVTEYALMIAQAMHLDKMQQKIIKYAALLHDIGKIGIQDQVLLKNGPFTAEERGEMNTHPSKTHSILDKFHFPKDLEKVPNVATHHHERVNGEGYPQGLSGSEIPLGSKILAVADVFDALTSPRDYPKYHGAKIMSNDAMPLSRAIAIIKDGAGSQFDLEVVEGFLNILPQALLMYRGTHFRPKYVDEMIRSLNPDLLSSIESA